MNEIEFCPHCGYYCSDKTIFCTPPIGGGVEEMNDLPKGKRILCLDFDGVLSSYKSGWKGARCIPDMPVSGALEFLAEVVKHFTVCIYSSRSRYFGGRRAMKRWLWDRYAEIGGVRRKKWFLGPFEGMENCPEVPRWYFNRILDETSMEPWEHEVDYGIKRLLRKIKFPTKKPPAFLQIDDRALTFTGTFPNVEEIKNFKPWNKK